MLYSCHTTSDDMRGGRICGGLTNLDDLREYEELELLAREDVTRGVARVLLMSNATLPSLL